MDAQRGVLQLKTFGVSVLDGKLYSYWHKRSFHCNNGCFFCCCCYDLRVSEGRRKFLGVQ